MDSTIFLSYTSTSYSLLSSCTLSVATDLLSLNLQLHIYNAPAYNVLVIDTLVYDCVLHMRALSNEALNLLRCTLSVPNDRQARGMKQKHDMEPSM